MRKPESHIEKRIGFMNESYDWKTVVIKNKSDWNIQDKKINQEKLNFIIKLFQIIVNFNWLLRNQARKISIKQKDLMI